jgi:hypothetical protein
MTLKWHVAIDWLGNGSYGYNEASYTTSVQIDRGRTDEWGEHKAGECRLVLDNTSGRFDPWDTGGALYPYINMPRRGLRVTVGEADASEGTPVGLLLALTKGNAYTIFSGYIDDIRPTGSIRDKKVLVRAFDGWKDLIGQEVSIALQESKTTDQAISAVLDEIGWDAGARTLDTGNDTISYFWLGERSAAQAIRELAVSEHGEFMVTRQGQARFDNRTAVLTASPAGSLDQQYFTGISVNQPRDSVRNYVRCTSYPAVLATSDDLWTLQDDDVLLKAGESLDIWAIFTDAADNRCPAKNVISPAATTDYTANTLANGSGADMTASLSVTPAVYSNWAKLTVSNTHASTALYITLLKIRGQAISRQATTVISEDTDSRDIYGRRKLDLELPWQQRVQTANDLALSLKGFHKDPHKDLTLSMEQRFPQMVQYDLGDRISMTAALYDIDEDMRLGQITFATCGDGNEMQGLKVAWHMEPCDNQTYWLLGVVGNSELGQSTRFGY